MEEGCYYPRIYLSDPAFSIPSSFRKQFTLTSLVLVFLPHRCWIVLKHQLQRNMKTLFFLGCIYFMTVRRCTVEFINFSILVVRWRRVGNTEGLRWIIQADVGQVALKGKTIWCVGRMRRRVIKAKIGAVSIGVLEAGLEDMDMRARRVVLVKLGWCVTPDRMLVSGSAPGDASWSDAIQMCLRRHHLSLLAPTFISRRGAGQGV